MVRRIAVVSSGGAPTGAEQNRAPGVIWTYWGRSERCEDGQQASLDAPQEGPGGPPLLFIWIA